MLNVALRLRLSALELGYTFTHQFGFCRCQGIVGINQALWRYEDAVLLLGESHEVPCPQIESFKDLPGDDDLASLSHAGDPLLSW
jgi:hypothetical protein